ncbi:3'-5' exonuclease [Heliophilum fasciatum]|uniref:DNA polymerase-3 subunit epsilon n=1 Tax=Heliophilum fasciatum TaxID=35700 RepID=A0A4R2SBW8_9FIRM|nr:3'-5' exonuclease [Heliophilum fasciatum]MCW2276874.1 DNA polymerase-3 subunit epsilon [Heliophilum fasciatum]TCP68665.1 DNA polymerase-3 subunit epsilon [Heliophilum fasciatum]
MDFVAIDFETANSYRNSACAVGITIVKNGQIEASHAWLIRPPKLYFQFTFIHGITIDDVRHQPTFGDLWPTLLPYLQGQILAAHNVSFDKSVLAATLAYYQLPPLAASWLCTVELSRKAWPDLHNHKLNTVAEYLGVNLNHHEARSDSIAAAQIVLHAGRQSKSITIQDIIAKHDLTRYLMNYPEIS